MQVLTIDGQSTDGWDGDRAAKILRGKSGSSVNVRFARRTEQMPGVAGRPEEPLKRIRLDPDAYQYRQVCGAGFLWLCCPYSPVAQDWHALTCQHGCRQLMGSCGA